MFFNGCPYHMEHNVAVKEGGSFSGHLLVREVEEKEKLSSVIVSLS